MKAVCKIFIMLSIASGFTACNKRIDTDIKDTDTPNEYECLVATIHNAVLEQYFEEACIGGFVGSLGVGAVFSLKVDTYDPSDTPCLMN